MGPDGKVLAHDDKAIQPNSMLIRHINVSQHVIFDENINGLRIASAAYSRTSGDPDYGMSIDIGQLLEEAGLPEAAMVPPGMGAVKLQVAAVRALNLRVGSDPMPANKYHGQAWGVKDSKREKLRKVALDWVVPIQGVAIK